MNHKRLLPNHVPAHDSLHSALSLGPGAACRKPQRPVLNHHPGATLVAIAPSVCQAQVLLRARLQHSLDASVSRQAVASGETRCTTRTAYTVYRAYTIQGWCGACVHTVHTEHTEHAEHCIALGLRQASPRRRDQVYGTR